MVPVGGKFLSRNWWSRFLRRKSAAGVLDVLRSIENFRNRVEAAEHHRRRGIAVTISLAEQLTTLGSFKPAAILVRPFHDFKEVTVCVDLQREIWGYSDLEVLPAQVFVVAQKAGGQILGDCCSRLRPADRDVWVVR
jgi:hypothetical protein